MIDHQRRHRPRNDLRRQVAGVGLFVHDDTRIGSQLPGKLAMADIDRMHLGGTMRQQHIGEAGSFDSGGDHVGHIRVRDRMLGARRSAAEDVVGNVGIAGYAGAPIQFHLAV